MGYVYIYICRIFYLVYHRHPESSAPGAKPVLYTVPSIKCRPERSAKHLRDEVPLATSVAGTNQLILQYRVTLVFISSPTSYVLTNVKEGTRLFGGGLPYTKQSGTLYTYAYAYAYAYTHTPTYTYTYTYLNTSVHM